ncbi:MAG: hypothetical protein WAO95_07500 [Burkholderiales bacterium]
MKKLLIASVAFGAFSTWSYLAFAGQDPSFAEKMDACFRAHAGLMDKPALKNIRACWRAHGYRMERDRAAG